MNTYEVNVWRTYHKYTTVTVDAENETEAGELAMDKADFSGSSLNPAETGYEEVIVIKSDELLAVNFFKEQGIRAYEDFGSVYVVLKENEQDYHIELSETEVRYRAGLMKSAENFVSEVDKPDIVEKLDDLEASTDAVSLALGNHGAYLSNV